MNPRARAALARTLRLAVAAGLTGYLLWKSHPRDVAAAAAGADWRPIALAVLLVLVDRTLMAYRWIGLLCTIERPRLAALLRIFFVSTFVGTFLPASIGADAVRAFSLSQLRVPAADAVSSVFLDRMLGITSLLLMALVGLVVAGGLAGNWTILLALAAAAAACAATLLLIFSARAERILASMLRRAPARPAAAGRQLLDALRRYDAHHRALVSVLALSVLVQLIRTIQAYFLGRGLGIDAPPSAYFAFIPIILLVMLLPVTFNGIGTSQAAFVWFFARAGVAAGPAFALSVLFVALGIVGNLPGGLLYAFGRRANGLTASG
ncbi:MAG TPA: lysylphosphatidylglycerol synthase transmembrane domain-containing protein [Vicinamibacterales bacterium]|nr:lysylphosphatidylglycerol synthase transmembrane domain-containing protein [Vicinamibacterales bacterium]